MWKRKLAEKNFFTLIKVTIEIIINLCYTNCSSHITGLPFIGRVSRPSVLCELFFFIFGERSLVIILKKSFFV